MIIKAAFNYGDVCILSEFTPATNSLYYYLGLVYSPDGYLIEHVSKVVSTSYVSNRLRTCRKYRGCLQVLRLCNNTWTTTYQRDYNGYALSYKTANN